MSLSISGIVERLAKRLGVSSTAILVVGGIAAAATAAAIAASFVGSSAKDDGVDENDPIASPLPSSALGVGGAASSASAGRSSATATMPKEKLLRILRRMHEETAAISQRLVEEMHRLSQTGMDESEMQAQYQETMARLMQESEARVGAEFGFTKDELLAAHIEHKDDDEVKEVSEQLKRVFFGDSEGEVGEVPEGMMADTFLDIYQRQFGLIDSAFTQMADVARVHAPKGEERIHFLDTLMHQNFERIIEQSIQISGMDMPTFQACVQKFQAEDPRFLQEASRSAQRLGEIRQRLLEDD